MAKILPFAKKETEPPIEDLEAELHEILGSMSEEDLEALRDELDELDYDDLED